MRDRLVPAVLVPAVALLALPAMSGPTWIALTVAGAAMGMMLFLMASGLTLIFGLMDVLNFAHAAFVTLGAYVAVSVFGGLAGWVGAAGWGPNLLALLAALAAACGGRGRRRAGRSSAVIVRRVYGSHLRQILITMGGLIVAEQLIVVAWGAQPLPLAKPLLLRGVLRAGGAPRWRPTAWWSWRSACWCGPGRRWCWAAPASACWCAPAWRTARWWRRSASASGACSSACSWPAPRWPPPAV